MKVQTQLWLVGLTAMAPLWGACVPIGVGQTVHGTGSRDYPACYLLVAEAGQPSQIVLEQGDDLELRVSRGSSEFVVDGFEFGTETLTIHEPGQYRVRVGRVDSSAVGVFNFVMSRKDLPLHEAVRWRDAEDWATRSKRSGKPEDITESLRAWDAIGRPAPIARTHLKMGDSLVLNDPSQARLSYESALAMCVAIADLRCVAEAANNSGYAAQRSGDFDGALKRLKQAAESWQRLSNHENESITWSNIGLWYQNVGAFSDAIRVLESAERALRAGDPLARSRVVNSIGTCYVNLAEIVKARAYFQSALAMAEHAKSLRDIARFRLNLGHTYLLDGDPARALVILSQAREEAANQPERGLRAAILDNLGQASLKLGDLQSAQASLQQALTIHREVGDKRGQAFDLHYLGSVSKALSRTDEARDYFSQSIQIRRDCGLRDSLTDSLFALAELEYDAHRLDSAREFSEQSLKLLESVRVQVPGADLRASFYSRKRRFFDLLVDIEMARADANPAAGLLAAERGRGRALMDLLAEGSLLRQLPAPMVANRTALQRQIDIVSVQLVGAKAGQEAALRGRLDNLLAHNDAIEAEARSTVSELPLGRPLSSIEDLQRAGLPADTALLEFHLGERQSYLWLVDRRQVRAFPLPTRGEVERLAGPVVEDFGKIQERQRSPQQRQRFTQSLRKLSDTLLGPLASVTLPRRLVLGLDGVLLRVPFAALTLPAGGPRLGLIHDLVQTPAAAYLLAGREPRPLAGFSKTILALSDPVFSVRDGRFDTAPAPLAAAKSSILERLPFQEDTDAIRKLVPPERRDVLTGFAVNRADLEKLRLADYGVLHFSTHALIDDRIPEVSRIALSLVDRAGNPVDGYLRPYQLAKFRLNGSVVVLSACDTALGKQVLGEGLAGFATSLFHAGAAQLVLALTKVDAKSSAEFFAEVYRHYLAAPMPMERALTLARQIMAKSGDWSDPYYWAPFVVVGRPAGDIR